MLMSVFLEGGVQNARLDPACISNGVPPEYENLCGLACCAGSVRFAMAIV
jgi:hypothetical protein